MYTKTKGKRSFPRFLGRWGVGGYSNQKAHFIGNRWQKSYLAQTPISSRKEELAGSFLSQVLEARFGGNLWGESRLIGGGTVPYQKGTSESLGQDESRKKQL